MVAVLTTEKPSPSETRPEGRHLRLVRTSPVFGTARVSSHVILRRRMAALLTVGVVVVFGWIGVQGLVAWASPGLGVSGPSHVVVVQPGETLWSIALAARPHGDVRPLVGYLTSETHDRPLYPGERVTVP